MTKRIVRTETRHLLGVDFTVSTVEKLEYNDDWLRGYEVSDGTKTVYFFGYPTNEDIRSRFKGTEKK